MTRDFLDYYCDKNGVSSLLTIQTPVAQSAYSYLKKLAEFSNGLALFNHGIPD